MAKVVFFEKKSMIFFSFFRRPFQPAVLCCGYNPGSGEYSDFARHFCRALLQAAPRWRAGFFTRCAKIYLQVGKITFFVRSIGNACAIIITISHVTRLLLIFQEIEMLASLLSADVLRLFRFTEENMMQQLSILELMTLITGLHCLWAHCGGLALYPGFTYYSEFLLDFSS